MGSSKPANKPANKLNKKAMGAGSVARKNPTQEITKTQEEGTSEQYFASFAASFVSQGLFTPAFLTAPTAHALIRSKTIAVKSKSVEKGIIHGGYAAAGAQVFGILLIAGISAVAGTKE
jgi:hypothetical protein